MMYQTFSSLKRWFGKHEVCEPDPDHTLYPDWPSARAAGAGYDTAQIIEKTIRAAEIVRASEGRLFDRDSVVLDREGASYPLLDCLLSAADGGNLRVVDFGGALGSTYRLYAPFLAAIKDLRWNVVEMPETAKVGRERFWDGRLRFYDHMRDVGERPHVVLFSGVLQYLDDPYAALAEVKALSPDLIIVDRTSTSELETDRFAIQVVPETIYEAKLPFWIFGRDRIGQALGPEYCSDLTLQALDPDMLVETVTVRFTRQHFRRSYHI